MLVKRVVSVLNCTTQEVLTKVFPEKAFDFFWRNTRGMPREIIRAASVTIDVARHNGHLRVDNADLEYAFREFSLEKIEDLGSEYWYRYPGIEVLVRRLRGWQREFPFIKLEELAISMAMDVEEKRGAASKCTWAGGFVEDPEGLARVLLHCGVLLLKANRTARPTVFDASSDDPIPSGAWFAVHPMYAPGLDLLGT